MKQTILLALGCLMMASGAWATDYTLTLYADGCNAPNLIYCPAGQQLSVSAKPMEHRHFVKWNDGNTDNPRLVTLNQNLTYTATFAPDTFNVSLAASPAAYGSVSGAGRYQYNDPAILTAIPNYGYQFSRWSDGNADNPRTIHVISDYSFQATFTKKQFNLLLTTSIDSQGSVSGGGLYFYQDSVTIQANSNVGYAFKQWNDGNTENPRTIYLVSDTAFTASFYQLYEGQCGDNLYWQYTNNTLTITGTGAMYDYTSSTMPWKLFCDSITKIIIPDGITYIGAYAFVGCNQIKELELPSSLEAMGEGALYNCTNIRSITCEAKQLVTVQSNTLNGISQYAKVYVPAELLEDYQFDINWSKLNIQPVGDLFTLSVNAINGSVSGGGKYSSGRSAVLTATPEYGYHFVQWSDSVTTNPRTVIVTCDTLFVAEFAKNTYSILTYADHGTITAPSQCLYLDNVSLSVVPDHGWIFSQWSDGNKDNPRIATITSDTTFTAIFEPLSFTLSVNAVHGSVSGGGKYSFGSSAVLTATPEYGYHFLQWSDSVTTNPRTVVVSSDTLFIAEFAKNSYSVHTYADHGTITAPSQCLYLENVSLAVVPDHGWAFSQWSDGNTDNPRVATITSDTTFTANFEPRYSFTIQTEDTKKGLVQGNNGMYPSGMIVTVSATGEYGYRFSHWSDGNTENPRQYTITEDVTLIAYFEADGGSCGDNLTWRFDVNTGTLYISGSGSMDDYPSQSAMPWSKYYSDIRTLILENGISHIGNYAFYGCKNLTSVTIPNSVISIGKYAFAECTKLAIVTLGAGLTSIGDKAFYNDYRIEKITSYAATMTPEVGIDAFYNVSKQYVYLYVSNESQRKYQVDPNWNGFDIRVIGAESSTSDDGQVVVTPGDDQATFSWPTDNNAGGYSIEITKDGVVFCTLKFYANGQLAGIAFIPGRNQQRHAPAAVMTATGYQFTVTGLNRASAYGFVLDVNDANQQLIKSYSGRFVTNGYENETYQISLSVNDMTMGYTTGAGTYDENTTVTVTAIANSGYEFLQWSNGIKDNPYTFTVTENIQLQALFSQITDGLEDLPASENGKPMKLFRDGQLYILRDGKLYNAQGAVMDIF